MNTDPFPPKRPFRVVFALGDAGAGPKMFEAAVRHVLKDTPLQFTVALSWNAAEVAAMDEVSQADLVITFASNLHGRLAGDIEAQGNEEKMSRRVRVLRAATTATLFSASVPWSGSMEQALLEAGADVAVELPFKMEPLKRAIELAHRRWLAGERT